MEIHKMHCLGCGSAEVNHRVEWLGAALDSLSSPIIAVFESIWRVIGKAALCLPWVALGEPMFRLLAALRLATASESFDAEDNLRTKALWESAEKRGIRLVQFRFFGNPNASVFVARRGRAVRVFEGLPRPERLPSKSLRWMDNKGKMKSEFQKAGIPVAAGDACFSTKRALEVFKLLDKPVIVKPHIGSRSRHTTVHVENKEELVRAFVLAKQLSPWAVVEEELRGRVFRASVVDGALQGVISRDPPHVVGDGKLSVQSLLEKENRSPLRQGPVFHEITYDDAAEAELRRQHLTRESVPLKGEVVSLNQKTSRSLGGSTEDVTDSTHSENKKLFEKVARVLGDSLVGIDFIIEDITRPWTEQKKCGVIECNSLPFLELHHYPLVGRARDVTGILLDIVFPV